MEINWIYGNMFRENKNQEYKMVSSITILGSSFEDFQVKMIPFHFWKVMKLWEEGYNRFSIWPSKFQLKKRRLKECSVSLGTCWAETKNFRLESLNLGGKENFFHPSWVTSPTSPKENTHITNNTQSSWNLVGMMLKY